jgi:predicted SAM-dependent methyltransferase
VIHDVDLGAFRERAPLATRIGNGVLHALDRHLIGRLRLRIASRRRPLRIALGATGSAPSGWTATDEQYLDLTRRETFARYLSPRSVDAILAEHVWEHLSENDGSLAAKNCKEFLTDGGYLRVAVPDGNHPSPEYREWVRPGGVGPGAVDHKVLYNLETLATLLEAAGYRVQPLEWFDGNSRFHEQPWNPEEGLIRRSRRFDRRNCDGVLRYTSLIVDAFPHRR